MFYRSSELNYFTWQVDSPRTLKFNFVKPVRIFNSPVMHVLSINHFVVCKRRLLGGQYVTKKMGGFVVFVHVSTDKKLSYFGNQRYEDLCGKTHVTGNVYYVLNIPNTAREQSCIASCYSSTSLTSLQLKTMEKIISNRSTKSNLPMKLLTH